MLATYSTATKFTVSGNKVSEFSAGRRVKLSCGSDGIFYSTITTSTLDGDNTEVIIDESVLTINLTDVYYSVISPGVYGGLPNHTHEANEGQGGNLFKKIEEIIFFLGG